MNIQTVTVKLYHSATPSQGDPLLEVFLDGKPERMIFLNDIYPRSFQGNLDGLKENPLVERAGVCYRHREHICRNIVYDKDSHKFYCCVGMRQYPVRDFAEGNVLFAKYIADSMIIPKTVDVVSGIDFQITEDEEVYIAWPTLVSAY